MDTVSAAEWLPNAAGTVMQKASSWAESFVALIPNMAVALVLMILFWLLARVVRRFFSRVFDRTSDNRALRDLFGTVLYYAVLGVGLFTVLDVLHLDKAVTSLLAGAGIVGLALGFAFQDIAANFIAGIILSFRRPFRLGDVVTLDGVTGVVQRLDLRTTTVRTFQGQSVYVPNKNVLQTGIVNYSTLGERRVDLDVGVSYGDALPRVESVVLDAIRGMEGVLRPEDTLFSYTGFGDSSINFRVMFWFRYRNEPDFLRMRNAAVKAIKAAFDEHGITIPFPIRTLDFGIKGGATLAEMPLRVASGEG